MKKSLFFAEWKSIFQNRKILIAIIAVMFVPILYSGMFLWAFWDPYEHLEDMPVAVVNEDIGAEFEGEKLTLGNDLVDKLKENDEFDFHFVDKKTGHEDLKKQKYYILVEIPKDFSENATTLMDEQPKKLELRYIPNESFNFLSAQIGETAIKEIKAAISKEVTSTYAEAVFEKVEEMADGFGEASEGAEKLDDGAKKLKDGSGTLKENLELIAEKSLEFSGGISEAQSGAKELAKGSSELSKGLGLLADGHGQLLDGAGKVQNGSHEIANGADQLKAGLDKASGGANELIDGTKQIHSGANTLSGKLGEYQAGVAEVAAGAESVHAGVRQLQQELEQVRPLLSQLPLPDEMKAQLNAKLAELEPNLQQLADGSGKVAGGTKQLQSATGELQGGATTLSNSIEELNKGQRELQAGLGELQKGSGELSKGAKELASGQNKLLEGMQVFDHKLTSAVDGAYRLSAGADKLTGGMGQLSDGSGKLSDGTNKLADGSKDLSKGTGELKDGTSEMKEKLTDAAEKASEVDTNDDTYDMMGEPVKVDNKGINKVPNYGTGFAPYFLSLGLFVGALLLSIVFHFHDPVIRPKNGFTWFMSKFGVIAIVGIIQALLAVAIMLFGLGIEVQSVPLFILTSIVTSLTFMTLIQFLVTLLADPGRFIAIILLILQLTTSAGTFPLELIPKVLQPLNALLPMTYTVQAYKAVISSGDYAFMWENLGILTLFAVVCMVLTLGYFMFKHKRQFYVKTEEATADQ